MYNIYDYLHEEKLDEDSGASFGETMGILKIKIQQFDCSKTDNNFVLIYETYFLLLFFWEVGNISTDGASDIAETTGVCPTIISWR